MGGGRCRTRSKAHAEAKTQASTTRLSNPKNTSLKFKIAFIILTFQRRTVLSVLHCLPTFPPPPLARAFVKYLFFGLDRRIYLLACALQQVQVPLTNVRTKPGQRERHRPQLDGCPEGPLQQGNRLKSAWKSEHQGAQEDTKTPEVSLTRTAEREEGGRAGEETGRCQSSLTQTEINCGRAARNEITN